MTAQLLSVLFAGCKIPAKEMENMINEFAEQHAKEIIKHLREFNPYPVDVFLEPSEEDWHNIGKFLMDHGKNGDRIFAKWGRMVWDNCVNRFEEILNDK